MPLSPVIRLLAVFQTVVLSAALPFAVIAVKGYRGTPWGHALLPLPVTVAGYLLNRLAFAYPWDGPVVDAVEYGSLLVAVGATALLAVRTASLLSERGDVA